MKKAVCLKYYNKFIQGVIYTYQTKDDNVEIVRDKGIVETVKLKDFVKNFKKVN